MALAYHWRQADGSTTDFEGVRTRLPEDVAGGKERFLIFDSLGGENLAERFGKTAGWQRFTYHRMAPLDGEITLTAALGGAGSALLDDVTIEAGR